jgi:hypothetical protein
MCEMFSWVEVRKDGKTDYLYLTDKDLHGLRNLWRRLFGKIDANTDWIGHGAIEAYYGIRSGYHMEVNDFWNLEKLPKELRPLFKTKKMFVNNFGELFQRYGDKSRVLSSKDAPKWLKDLSVW